MKKITLFALTLLCTIAGWAQETVTPPESAEFVDYTLSYTDVDYQDNQTPYKENRQVAFDGNDIYFRGLGINENVWVKGTLDGTTVTIANKQFCGASSGTNYYLAGRTSQSGGLEDIVFTYVEESGVFYCEHEILAVDANDYVAGRMIDVILTPGTVSYEGLPETATVYEYTFRLTEAQSLDNLEDVQTTDYTGHVAFDGQDVYIQGLGYEETTWIKGTLDGNTVTFAARQPAGVYQSTNFFLIGYNGQETSIVFNYDATTGTLTLGDMYIVMIDSDNNAWGVTTYAVLMRSGQEQPVDDEVVTPPANINPQPYIFSGSRMVYDEEGNYQGTETATWNIKVAWNGASEVYVQGLCSAFPTAWVKGTVDDDEVTFAKNQYFGRQLYPFYLAGQYFGELSDFITIYDASTREFKANGCYMVINSSKTSLAPYGIFVNVTLTPGEVAAVPMAPQVGGFMQKDEEYFGENGSVEFIVIPVDENGYALPTDKLGYEIVKKYADGNEVVVAFDKNSYPNTGLNGATVVPYDFTDNWSILLYPLQGYNGYLVELVDVDYPTVGVRTVFSGGGEVNRSETTWLDCEGFVPPVQDPTVISQLSANNGQTTYTDLMGRSVTGNAKGIVVRTITRPDGTKQSIKVVR